MAQLFAGITAILNDVWDAVNHWLRVSVQNVVAVSGTVTANQGTPNAGGANAWPITTSDVTITGTLVNDGDTVTIALGGQSCVVWELNFGTAQYRSEGFDGAAWGPLSSTQVVSNGGQTQPYNIGYQFFPSGGNITAICVVGGYQQFRIHQVGASTQTSTVTITKTAASGEVRIVDVLPSGQSLIGFTPPTLYSPAHIGDLPNTFYLRERNVEVFRTATATASGNTPVWTPAAGKKFRLMRFYLELTENVIRAAAGVVTIKFQDATTDLNIAFDVWVPAAALATTGNEWQSGWIDIGNGILSAAANNVLNVNLSAALTGGNLRAFVCGTEE